MHFFVIGPVVLCCKPQPHVIIIIIISVVHVVFIYIDDNGINIQWQMETKTSNQVKPETKHILAYTMYVHAGLT